MVKNDEQTLADLVRGSAGLLFMSESDYPFEAIKCDGTTELTTEFIRSLTDEPQDCQIQEIKVEYFLRAGQYRDLLGLLRSNLSDLKAYKVGLINMRVYIVGRSPEGNWLGLSTRVVET